MSNGQTRVKFELVAIHEKLILVRDVGNLIMGGYIVQELAWIGYKNHSDLLHLRGCLVKDISEKELDLLGIYNMI